MSRSILTSIVFLVALSITVGQQAFSLEECVQHGLVNSTAVLLANEDVKDADGQIKEYGSHEELLQLNGQYKQLYLQQFKSSTMDNSLGSL